MGRHLVLAGCGHAHLAVLVEIGRFMRRFQVSGETAGMD